mmetsp:Transcript_7844/g.19435  ORF Transcript_7844/g.19435 Transcript_7844/m.19435 type:complete len:248 (-) Transcript_7844:133-876(-)
MGVLQTSNTRAAPLRPGTPRARQAGAAVYDAPHFCDATGLERRLLHSHTRRLVLVLRSPSGVAVDVASQTVLGHVGPSHDEVFGGGVQSQEHFLTWPALAVRLQILPLLALWALLEHPHLLDELCGGPVHVHLLPSKVSRGSQEAPDWGAGLGTLGDAAGNGEVSVGELVPSLEFGDLGADLLGSEEDVLLVVQYDAGNVGQPEFGRSGGKGRGGGGARAGTPRPRHQARSCTHHHVSSRCRHRVQV